MSVAKIVELTATGSSIEEAVEAGVAKAGESLRYRCDRPHSVRCIGDTPGRATMVCILKAAVMD